MTRCGTCGADDRSDRRIIETLPPTDAFVDPYPCDDEWHLHVHRVLVCGTRDGIAGDDLAVLERRMTELRPDWVIEGGARGVDRQVREIAKRLNCGVVTYEADWRKYGRAAGPIRNQKMIDYGKPDLVLAFLVPDSKGTRDMISRAKAAGIAVEVHECSPHIEPPDLYDPGEPRPDPSRYAEWIKNGAGWGRK